MSGRASSRISISEVHTAEGVDDALTLMEAAHCESRYAAFPFDPGRFRKYHQMTTLTNRDHYTLALVCSGSDPVGLVHIGCSHLYWAKLRVAVISIVFVLPQYRRTLAGARAFLALLEYAAHWSRARCIDEIQIQVTSGTRLESIDSAVRRMGFRQVGSNYVWPLPSD